MWCLVLVTLSFHWERRQPWHREPTRTRNTWALYNTLQLLNQPWKQSASKLLVLANRSSLCKPLILDILLLYLKLKMTFTICEITNRMGPISLLEKFWISFIKGKKKPEYLLKTFSLFFFLYSFKFKRGALSESEIKCTHYFSSKLGIWSLTFSLITWWETHLVFVKARCSARNSRVTDRGAGWAQLTAEITLS